MFNRVLNSKTKTIYSAAFVLAASALISQILGFFRDNLLANIIPKEKTDIYFAAFRIPDFVYGILITGGIIAAFLPVFAEYFRKNKEDAYKLTNNVLFVFLFFLVVICLLLAIFTPSFIKFIVPGFTSQQRAETIVLMRILFLSPILLGVSAIFSSILQYFDLFFAYSLAPIFYNLGIIFGILVFWPIFGISGLGFGVILGALLHLFIQILPVFRLGYRPKFSFKIFHPGLQKIFKLMTPRIFSSIANHLNLIFITIIASGLAAGSITVFNFANNLALVPMSLIGLSFATAIFPSLSRSFAGKNGKELFEKFFSVFSQILFLIIPFSFLMFFLRAQIVRLVLGTAIIKNGGFGWQATRLTAASLGILAIPLFAMTLIPLLIRTFFSLQNTKTPFKIAVFSVSLNIFFCFYFVWLIKNFTAFSNLINQTLKLEGISDISVISLPIAIAISSIVQFFLLVFYLKKDLPEFKLSLFLKPFNKILLASILMSVLVWFSLRISFFLNLKTFAGVFIQTFFALAIGVSSYLYFSYRFKIKEAKLIVGKLFQRKGSL